VTSKRGQQKLSHLFLEIPSPMTIIAVSAFFFGYGIPLSIANYFYNVCSELGVHVTVDMYSFYNGWAHENHELHQARYYNTKHKKFIWINAKDHPQLETVLPEVSDIPLGFADTDLSELI